jgi:hypothetical protein
MLGGSGGGGFDLSSRRRPAGNCVLSRRHRCGCRRMFGHGFCESSKGMFSPCDCGAPTAGCMLGGRV